MKKDKQWKEGKGRKKKTTTKRKRLRSNYPFVSKENREINAAAILLLGLQYDIRCADIAKRITYQAVPRCFYK